MPFLRVIPLSSPVDEISASSARLLWRIWSLSCGCTMTSAASFLLRHALDIREHYERKLERANNLYMELSAVMLQLELKEKELQRYENKSMNTGCICVYYANILYKLISHNAFTLGVFFTGESSLWIRSIQVCLSTTAPDRAAPPTPWTNSSRREMSHRNCPRERGGRSHFSRYLIKD